MDYYKTVALRRTEWPIAHGHPPRCAAVACGAGRAHLDAPLALRLRQHDARLRAGHHMCLLATMEHGRARRRALRPAGRADGKTETPRSPSLSLPRLRGGRSARADQRRNRQKPKRDRKTPHPNARPPAAQKCLPRALMNTVISFGASTASFSGEDHEAVLVRFCTKGGLPPTSQPHTAVLVPLPAGERGQHRNRQPGGRAYLTPRAPSHAIACGCRCLTLCKRWRGWRESPARRTATAGTRGSVRGHDPSHLQRG